MTGDFEIVEEPVTPPATPIQTIAQEPALAAKNEPPKTFPKI